MKEPCTKNDKHVQDKRKEQPENKLPARRGSEVSYPAVFLSYCCNGKHCRNESALGGKYMELMQRG